MPPIELLQPKNMAGDYIHAMRLQIGFAILPDRYQNRFVSKRYLGIGFLNAFSIESGNVILARRILLAFWGRTG